MAQLPIDVSCIQLAAGFRSVLYLCWSLRTLPGGMCTCSMDSPRTGLAIHAHGLCLRHLGGFSCAHACVRGAVASPTLSKGVRVEKEPFLQSHDRELGSFVWLCAFGRISAETCADVVLVQGNIGMPEPHHNATSCSQQNGGLFHSFEHELADGIPAEGLSNRAALGCASVIFCDLQSHFANL